MAAIVMIDGFINTITGYGVIVMTANMLVGGFINIITESKEGLSWPLSMLMFAI